MPGLLLYSVLFFCFFGKWVESEARGGGGGAVATFFFYENGLKVYAFRFLGPSFEGVIVLGCLFLVFKPHGLRKWSKDCF